MKVRRPIVVAWAGLCLAGAAATAALDTGSPPEELGWFPAEEPTPPKTHAVDCQEIADEVEQARAEAGRERREAPARGTQTATSVWVPDECVDELEERGLPLG
ncbi:hypothetical protein [Streptomyces sp. NPDC017890]|uniref:hypothetical protein n=1 Tax=Streptomyces sp. NPDC017890 TaxID=3365015 RepID=UPI0037A28321